MEDLIDRRTAVVGGGASGIGRATAEQLASAGMRVVLTGRTEESLSSAVDDLRHLTGGDVLFRVSDLADGDASARLVDDVESSVGAVDVLVVNAGGPPPGRILEIDDAAWQAGFDLLLGGPLRLARAAVPRMAARGFGRVIFVTSTAVRQPQPDLAVSVVLRSAITAAAKLLSRASAAEGVTVNCVAPGATATARRTAILTNRAAAVGATFDELDTADSAAIPRGRPAHPDEVAAAVAFLASDAAAHINGTVLTVDGGQTEAIW